MTMCHQIKKTNTKTKYKQEKHGNSGSDSTLVEIKKSLDGFNSWKGKVKNRVGKKI